MASYERKGLSSDQLDFAERMTNPRTPKDLEEALRYPNTPASKMFEEMLLEHELLHIIADKLTEQFIQNQVEASKQEKAEFMRMLIATEAANQKVMKEFEEQQLKAALNALNAETQGITDIRAQLDKLPGEIAATKAQISVLENELNEIHAQQAKMTEEWRGVAETQVEKISDFMAKNDLHFVGPNDVAVSQQDANDVLKELIVAEKSPVEVMNLVAAAYEQYNKSLPIQKDAAGIPIPPERPPFIAAPEIAGMKAALKVEIEFPRLLMRKLIDNGVLHKDASEDILLMKKVRKLNVQVLEQMPTLLTGLNKAYAGAAVLEGQKLDGESELKKLDEHLKFIEEAAAQLTSKLQEHLEKSSPLSIHKGPTAR